MQRVTSFCAMEAETTHSSCSKAGRLAQTDSGGCAGEVALALDALAVLLTGGTPGFVALMGMVLFFSIFGGVTFFAGAAGVRLSAGAGGMGAGAEVWFFTAGGL